MSLNIECLKVSPDDISEWLHLAPALLRIHLISAATSQADPDSSLLAWGLTIKSKNLDRPVKVALVLADCDEVTNEADELIDVLKAMYVNKTFKYVDAIDPEAKFIYGGNRIFLPRNGLISYGECGIVESYRNDIMCSSHKWVQGGKLVVGTEERIDNALKSYHDNLRRLANIQTRHLSENIPEEFRG